MESGAVFYLPDGIKLKKSMAELEPPPTCRNRQHPLSSPRAFGSTGKIQGNRPVKVKPPLVMVSWAESVSNFCTC
jgi:hypothetical protein